MIIFFIIGLFVAAFIAVCGIEYLVERRQEKLFNEMWEGRDKK
jgi:hypothetical protein